MSDKWKSNTNGSLTCWKVCRLRFVRITVQSSWNVDLMKKTFHFFCVIRKVIFMYTTQKRMSQKLFSFLTILTSFLIIQNNHNLAPERNGGRGTCLVKGCLNIMPVVIYSGLSLLGQSYQPNRRPCNVGIMTRLLNQACQFCCSLLWQWPIYYHYNKHIT